jgi:hypothetical protein
MRSYAIVAAAVLSIAAGSLCAQEGVHLRMRGRSAAAKTFANNAARG